MLRFILGAAGSGKTSLIYDEICKENGNVLLFVPDQFVFETEKLIAEKTDEKSQNIKISGFSSLSEEILKKYSPRKAYADSTAKFMIMLRAVRSLRDSFKYYGSAAYKSTFIPFCLSAVSEFKSAGITSDRLSNTADKLSGALGDKLSDMGMLMSLYNELLQQIYDDRQDNLLLAARLAEENDCFAGYSVYIDGFDSFTGAQLKFLEPMVRQSDSCTAALCIDNNSSCFETVQKTRAALSAFAEKEFAEIKEIRLDGAPRYKSKAMRALRDGLVQDIPAPADIQYNPDDIVTAYSADKSGEADFVCSCVKKLMAEGMRCRDIAVLCPASADYLSAVKSAFLRYDIPLFADIPVPISEKPLMKYIEYLLLAAYSPTGENVMRYIKSGFVRVKAEDGKTRPVTLREINAIEEYANRWGLYDRMWTKPFARIEGEDEQAVERLRDEIVNALVQIKSDCEGCDGREITKKFTSFLFSQGDISASIQGKCQDYTTRSLMYDKELTEEYNYLWETVSGMLTAAYETLDGTALSLKEYALVLHSAAQQITMSQPPQVLDSVLFGDPDRTRTAEVKAVFVMGAKNGVFPEYSTGIGQLFTKSENDELIKNGIELDSDPDRQNAAQQLSVYKALTLAEEKLYITWTGGEQDCTEVIDTIKTILPDVKTTDADSLPAEFYCHSPAAAKKQLSKCKLINSRDADAITLALKNTGEQDYLRLVKRAERGLSDYACIHDAGAAAPLIFDFEKLSPTGINLLSSCRFAYFCRYGLKIRERQTKMMTPANFGNTVHFVMNYCFERLFTQNPENGGKETAPDIPALVEQAMELYLSEFFLPREELGARFLAVYDSVKTLCVYLITYMKQELENSAFKPAYFELSLEDGKVLPSGFKAEPFTLDTALPDGTRQSIRVFGTVDRVDTAKDESGKKWLRVIDYKTGSKDISVSKIYYGLDLQLLLYLFTLCENNPDFSPSAATYYPAGSIPLKNTTDADEELRRGFWLDEHREKGFAVKGSQSDKEKALYNSVKITPSGKIAPESYFSATVISEDALGKMKHRISKVICEDAGKVKTGNVNAYPLVEDGTFLSCRYCKLEHICGRSEKHIRDVNGNDAVQFAQEITAEESENGR